jgi:DNA segregation ATPase FtsK/SpoIIIE, S-DNA-T family
MRPDPSMLSPVYLADRADAGGSPPLRYLIESAPFSASDSPLAIAMGEDCGGQPLVADLKTFPHLLITGVSGSGKSTFLRAVVTALLCRCSPRDLHLFLFSSDSQTFRACEGLPHLLAPPTSDPEAAAAFLEWAHHTMNDRYVLLASAGCRTVDAFNREGRLPFLANPPEKPGRPLPSTLPYIVAAFDDLRALSGHWGHGVLEATVAVFQMSRAVGIHLLIATADLSRDGLPGQINLNVVTRLSFRQTSALQSSIAVGVKGAEDLTEAGEALYCAPTARRAVSMRTPWVSEAEMSRVVKWWR